MTEAQVKALLMTATTVQEWEAAKDTIKAAHGGQFPSFWQADIIETGFATKALEAFRYKQKTKIERVTPNN